MMAQQLKKSTPPFIVSPKHAHQAKRVPILMTTSLAVALISSPVFAEEIDVMMVFDSTAKAWVDNNGGMELFSLDIQNRMNQVASNSGLDLEFNIVHSLDIDYTTQATTNSSSFYNDLVALRQGQGVFSSVAAARETYGADLVTMMVDHGSAYGNVGLGYSLIYWQGDSSAAFSVAAIRSVDISNTLVHELGHNLGAAHPKALSSGAGPNSYLDNQYSAGWFFTGSNGKAYSTAMGYNYNDGTYYAGAPLFSTPYVNYQGVAAGDQADADNTRLINDTMSVVASYRESVCQEEHVSAWNTVTGELADFDSMCNVQEPWQAGSPPDSDGDGLDDAYELRNGLDPDNPNDGGVADPAIDGDADGDGTPDERDSHPEDPTRRGSDLLVLNTSHEWTSVVLPSTYDNPVVIAGPPSFNNSSPGVVRIKNVTREGYETRFSVNFSEWDYLDGEHASETIPHVVLESGRYTMPDGSIWEVGTFTLDKTRNFQAQTFSASFAAAPRIFLTMQTANEAQAAIPRVKSVTATGFSAALYEQESLNNGHAAETVGYLAVYSPHGSGKVILGGEEVTYLTQQTLVTHEWLPLINSSIFVEEEQSRDSEVAHTTETIDAISIGGQLFAQDVSTRGGDASALRQQPQIDATPVEWGYLQGITDQWTTVPLGKDYSAPVVTASVGELSNELGAIQIRNVTPTSFDIRFSGWDYQGGTHVNGEKIFYLVADSGEYQLGDLVLKAGRSDVEVTASQSVNVSYGSSFSEPPVIFTSVNSVNDEDVVVARVLSNSNAGIQLALQEQESLSNGHASEVVGWIAIEKGNTDIDGRSIEVTTAYGANKVVNFNKLSSNKHPVVVTALASFRGADTAYAAHRALSSSKVSAYVQEEQSRDSELGHTSETISIFIAD